MTIENLAYQGGVMYIDAPEEHHFYRFLIFFEVNVLWANSGLGIFVVGFLLCAGLGIGIEAGGFSM